VNDDVVQNPTRSFFQPRGDPNRLSLVMAGAKNFQLSLGPENGEFAWLELVFFSQLISFLAQIAVGFDLFFCLESFFEKVGIADGFPARKVKRNPDLQNLICQPGADRFSPFSASGDSYLHFPISALSLAKTGVLRLENTLVAPRPLACLIR